MALNKVGTLDPAVEALVGANQLPPSTPRPSLRHTAPSLTRTWGARLCRGADGHGWGWVHMGVCTDPRYSIVTMILSLQQEERITESKLEVSVER
jgi:hypothetical protein